MYVRILSLEKDPFVFRYVCYIRAIRTGTCNHKTIRIRLITILFRRNKYETAWLSVWGIIFARNIFFLDTHLICTQALQDYWFNYKWAVNYWSTELSVYHGLRSIKMGSRQVQRLIAVDELMDNLFDGRYDSIL
jgi:hypothetical protein